MSMPSTSLPSKSLEKFSPDFVGRIGGSVRLKHVWLRNCNATKLCSVFKCAPVHSVLTRKWPNQPTRGFISWKMKQRLWKAKNSFSFRYCWNLGGPVKEKTPWNILPGRSPYLGLVKQHRVKFLLRIVLTRHKLSLHSHNNATSRSCLLWELWNNW